jgi:WD40 repeat protein
VRLWDVRDPAHPKSRGALTSPAPVAFRSDGRVLATGGDKHAAQLWDIANPDRPKILATLPAGTSGPIALSTDGHYPRRTSEWGQAVGH